jgi:hypothetical protein
MMSLDFEQKNKNILNRFESKTTTNGCTAYNTVLQDGRKMVSIDMQNRTWEEMLKSEKSFWGDRFAKLEYVKG